MPAKEKSPARQPRRPHARFLSATTVRRPSRVRRSGRLVWPLQRDDDNETEEWRSCKCPAIRGRKRCRIHGGLSPGAPRGEQNGNFKDGFWTCEAVQERRWAKEMVELYTKETDE